MLSVFLHHNKKSYWSIEKTFKRKNNNNAPNKRKFNKKI